MQAHHKRKTRKQIEEEICHILAQEAKNGRVNVEQTLAIMYILGSSASKKELIQLLDKLGVEQPYLHIPIKKEIQHDLSSSKKNVRKALHHHIN